MGRIIHFRYKGTRGVVDKDGFVLWHGIGFQIEAAGPEMRRIIDNAKLSLEKLSDFVEDETLWMAESVAAMKVSELVEALEGSPDQDTLLRIIERSALALLNGNNT